jgi:hypothetical protein
VTNRIIRSRPGRAATAQPATAQPVPPHNRRRRGLLITAAVLLAIGGCESSTAGRGTAPSTQSTTGTSRGPGAGTPSTPASAADGANVSACADARCEVLVRAGTAIPVPARTGIRAVRVARVTDEQVTLTGHDIGNSSAGSCSGRQCDISSTNGAFTIKLGPDSQAIENGLSVTVNRITDGVAVLRLEPTN